MPMYAGRSRDATELDDKGWLVASLILHPAARPLVENAPGVADRWLAKLFCSSTRHIYR